MPLELDIAASSGISIIALLIITCFDFRYPSSDSRVLIQGPGGDVDHPPDDTNSGLGGI